MHNFVEQNKITLEMKIRPKWFAWDMVDVVSIVGVWLTLQVTERPPRNPMKHTKATT